jgi:hypothetical protein
MSGDIISAAMIISVTKSIGIASSIYTNNVDIVSIIAAQLLLLALLKQQQLC